jgi:hypothetical protein
MSTAINFDYDFDALQAQPARPSLLYDEKKAVDIRLTLENRFGDLEPEQRKEAEAMFFSQNLCDFSDCVDVGLRRLFDGDELSEFQDALALEEYCGNDGAVQVARDVMQAQKRFSRDRAGNDKQAREKPETARDFEKLLRDAGYSKNEAREITSKGFDTATVRR